MSKDIMLEVADSYRKHLVTSNFSLFTEQDMLEYLEKKKVKEVAYDNEVFRGLGVITTGTVYFLYLDNVILTPPYRGTPCRELMCSLLKDNKLSFVIPSAMLEKIRIEGVSKKTPYELIFGVESVEKIEVFRWEKGSVFDFITFSNILSNNRSTKLYLSFHKSARDVDSSKIIYIRSQNGIMGLCNSRSFGADYNWFVSKYSAKALLNGQILNKDFGYFFNDFQLTEFCFNTYTIKL